MQIKHSSTNLGLVLSLGGSLLALPFNKKYHVAFGIMLTAWAGVHSWQHRKSLTKHLYKEVSGIGNIFAGCTNFLQQKTSITFLSKNTQVLHYLPGRVRLYSHQLLNNLNHAHQVKEYLNTMLEIHNFSVNPATGSILIQYSPDDIGNNPLLAEVETLEVRRYISNRFVQV